ncbi:Transketolase, thiamine diphosphate binding domain-domain-containing protein [Coniella lustricola]|uniref:Transketolase, thiamine diphosphate binding domain-domain-containing protein n=1 Tax=Coniella lustricola TaxID=2025994 RepID=A0A2T3A8L0_9PEZI|nr:Transketolase, thiamine diphosphate binding domain-domain-containing protein [Coniella lustricola]
MAPGRVDGNPVEGSTIHAAKDQLVTAKKQPAADTRLTRLHDHVLKTYRILIADLCQQFNMGHPGGAIGMAAIGVALWKYAMRYAPHSPDWFNRDRFVLSNGHACLFQYSFLHLSGYKAMTFEQLKSYHSERADSLCPGHPEIEIEGIEVTTGPLGQGVANAVGLAVATKNLAATYNQPGNEVVSNHTWCMIGDACLQEGVGLEAISLAGHWRLNNLTIIYDNNQITCDGSVDMVNNEDINAKMRACGFHVLEVSDGCYDIDGIAQALETARHSSEKPYFINIKTTIGLGSAVAGKAASHGAPFGAEDVKAMKVANGFDPEKHFEIGAEVRDFFSELPERGKGFVTEWEEALRRYCGEFPELGEEFQARMRGEIRKDWRELVPKTFDTAPTASRVSGGKVINPLAKAINSFMVGTADLSPSVNMIWEGKVDFQPPSLQTACGINGTYAGRYLHYGIREHAMAGIANGLAAFSRGTILPVTSSFFMFYLYAAPAVRMGALQHLHVIHVATHDSIGAGEDGPTHQPIELAALFRSMPHLLYIRPGDSEEVAGAWEVAIAYTDGSSIISESRHKIPQLHGGGEGKGLTRRDGVAKGAYVLQEVDDADTADVTIIGVGAELSFAVDVAAALQSERGVRARVVSFPCWRLFEMQSVEYRRSVLRRHGPKDAHTAGIPVVVIEPYAPNGWERYADAGINMRTFGHSLPGKYIYDHFGFETVKMTDKVVGYLEGIKEGKYIKGEFVDL